MTNFAIGQRVIVKYKLIDNCPGWGWHDVLEFTGTICEGNRYWPVAVTPDRQFQPKFTERWFCAPEWVHPEGGPW